MEFALLASKYGFKKIDKFIQNYNSVNTIKTQNYLSLTNCPFHITNFGGG